ncbi:MAG: T9SS type A sorting domain-containing protein, partial [Candidatus Coatesbacteria bacterium]
GNFRTLGFTVELNQSFYPDDSEIAPTCAMTDDVLREWAEWCLDEFTGVEIAYFDARWRNGGEVELTWDVSDAAEVAGFNIYRESELDPARKLVNGQLISGRGPFVYADVEPDPRRSYDYYLEAIDGNGVAELFGPVHLEATEGPKKAFALYQSRPNPSDCNAVIAFDIPADAAVKLVLYDVTGREVTKLVDETLPAGEHTADVSGLPAGVYIYRLNAGDLAAAKKMVIR